MVVTGRRATVTEVQRKLRVQLHTAAFLLAKGPPGLALRRTTKAEDVA